MRKENQFTRSTVISVLFLLLASSTISCVNADNHSQAADSNETTIVLPEPRYESNFSLEQALLQRRSTRSFSDEPIKLSEVSQILWAAQGITREDRGYRTAPSAGATFPLELYLVVGRVDDLKPGLYRYEPVNHNITVVKEGDIREGLAAAALGQNTVREGAISVIILTDYSKITGRYGERGIRYVHNEVGHVGQNIHLQAEALGLGTVVIGAFRDADLKNELSLPDNLEPLYIMPIGRI